MGLHENGAKLYEKCKACTANATPVICVMCTPVNVKLPEVKPIMLLCDVTPVMLLPNMTLITLLCDVHTHHVIAQYDTRHVIG